MQLSIRLSAVAALAKDAERLADIGTDHGYIPIYLAQQGTLISALAMDVNKGPLLRAQENIRKYHLEEVIQTRLSDGAEKLLPKEADTVVIAGMGGALTIKILEESRDVLADVENFVLQPQSEISLVRKYLHANGFCICREDMVKDEGKYYPMMLARHGKQEPWSEQEYRFGKYLIQEKNACLQEFLKKEEQSCLRIIGGLLEKEGVFVQDALKKQKQELSVIQKTMEEFT